MISGLFVSLLIIYAMLAIVLLIINILDYTEELSSRNCDREVLKTYSRRIIFFPIIPLLHIYESLIHVYGLSSSIFRNAELTSSNPRWKKK